MTPRKISSNFSLLRSALAGGLALSALGCNAGVELRPSLPGFKAQADIGGAARASTSTGGETAAMEPATPVESPYSASASFVQSGGGSPESAELAAPGSMIIGRVSKGAPRYYSMDFAVGDSVEFKAYARKLQGGGRIVVSILEPDNVRLGGFSNYVIAPSSEYERKVVQVTASQAGRHLLKVEAESSPLEYKIHIASVNLAAR